MNMVLTEGELQAADSGIECQQLDSGFVSLAVLLRVNGVRATAGEIRFRCGDGLVGFGEMAVCAKTFGLKAREQTTNWSSLQHAALPAIACLRDGAYLILASFENDAASVIHPDGDQEALTQDQFHGIWDGRIVVLTPSLASPQRLFKALLHPIKILQRLPQAIIPVARRLALAVRRSRPMEAEAPLVPETPPVRVFGEDSGLMALVILLRWHGVMAAPEQISHHCGSGRIGITEMLRCAKQLGLRASARKTNWERLKKSPLPGIAALHNGAFVVLGQVAGDKVLVQRPPSPRPVALSREELESLWDGHLVLMARRASLSELARRFDVTWFARAIYKYRRLMGEVLIASFFLQFFALVSPLFFQLVIDKVLVHQSMSTLDVLVVGLLGISTFEAVLGALRTYVFAHTTNRIDVELGARLYRHLLALPLAYFQARRVGDSVARVRELENIRQFLTSSALTLVVDLAFTLLFLVVMLYYSALLTLVVVAGFPFYIGVSLVATPLFQHRLDEKFRRGAENQSFLVESVAGVETLKAMAVEPQMQRLWEEQLAGYVTASFRVTSLGNVASQVVQWANKLVTAGILFYGAGLVIEGRLSVGELVAFSMLASRVNAPVLRLAQIWQDFHQVRLSIARLGDILNMVPEPHFVAGRPMLASIRGHVLFEHVTFRYRVDEGAVLEDVSLDIKPGEVIGIVGASGSGKSTIAKLVQRLYIPESGRVRIDGIDLSMVDLAWLRRQIGVVLQESVLFNRSIRDNIALADPSIEFDRVVAVAQLAGAHDFIMEMPDGYDTVVGERGSRLSGGQRQRIAIARALIGDPRILIFDEATSALDYESERAIQQRMSEIAARRTVIVIAHRLSTVRNADRIITLDRGRVAEHGTHDDLVRLNGRYAKLHGLQAGLHGVG